MAPEVIEHNPYRERADVFSFGIMLWELLTGRVPYDDMTPLQARSLPNLSLGETCKALCKWRTGQMRGCQWGLLVLCPCAAT